MRLTQQPQSWLTTAMLDTLIRRLLFVAVCASLVVVAFLYVAFVPLASVDPADSVCSQASHPAWIAGDGPVSSHMRISFVGSLKPMELPLPSPSAVLRGEADDTVWRQANAIQSWLAVSPEAEVYVVGDDSAEAFAEQRDRVHFLQGVQTTSSGVPVLSDMLAKLKLATKDSLLAFSNADIIMTPDGVRTALQHVCAAFSGDFLVVGRRTDVDITGAIDFQTTNVEARFAELAASPSANLQSPMYKDFFFFTRDLWDNDDVPPLAVGRARFDDWMVRDVNDRYLPVVDITRAANVLHQNHNYNHVLGGKSGAWSGEDAQKNLELAGDLRFMTDIDFATHRARGRSPRIKVYRMPIVMVFRVLVNTGLWTYLRYVVSPVGLVGVGIVALAGVLLYRRSRATDIDRSD